MLSIDPQLRLAYELLHEYRNFNEKATEANCSGWFDELVLKFQNSHITEYIPAWKLLKNWRKEILNSFTLYNNYRVSNGPMERLNRDLKTILRLAYGANNFTRIRNRFMYAINSDAYISYTRKQYTNKRSVKPRGNYHKNK